MSTHTAGVPREVWQGTEPGKQIEECPGDDDAVVDVQVSHHHHGGHPHTLQHRAQLGDESHPTRAQVLAHSHLQ